jgi:hypothetical protein
VIKENSIVVNAFPDLLAKLTTTSDATLTGAFPNDSIVQKMHKLIRADKAWSVANANNTVITLLDSGVDDDMWHRYLFPIYD